MYDVAIIGAGAGGITSAIYLSRAGLSVALIEKGAYGGQILNTDVIQNYTGFPVVFSHKLAEDMEEQAKRQENVDHIFGNVRSVTNHPDKLVLNLGKETIEAKKLIIATGVNHKKIGVPGEQLFDGHGVSYCTVCDGAFFKDQDVIVVGGGDSAVESALYLENIAKSVKVIHRRDKLRAEQITQNNLFDAENIDVIWDTTVEEILGENKVDGVTLRNKKGETTTLDTNGVFVNIGMLPASDTFKELNILDDNGFIITDEGMETANPNIFGVGDIRSNSIMQISNAAGDGSMAADTIIKQFNEER